MCNIFRVCALFNKKKKEKRLYVGNQLAIIERFHSRSQQLSKFIGTKDKKRIGYDRLPTRPPFYMVDVTSSANAHLRQPNTNYKLTFHYSSLYVSVFTNSDYVIFSMELVFCFFEDWLPTWPLYMADVNSCKKTL